MLSGGRAISHFWTCSEAEIFIFQIERMVCGVSFLSAEDYCPCFRIIHDIEGFDHGFVILDGEGNEKRLVTVSNHEFFLSATYLGEFALEFLDVVGINHVESMYRDSLSVNASWPVHFFLN